MGRPPLSRAFCAWNVRHYTWLGAQNRRFRRHGSTVVNVLFPLIHHRACIHRAAEVHKGAHHPKPGVRGGRSRFSTRPRRVPSPAPAGGAFPGIGQELADRGRGEVGEFERESCFVLEPPAHPPQWGAAILQGACTPPWARPSRSQFATARQSREEPISVTRSSRFRRELLEIPAQAGICEGSCSVATEGSCSIAHFRLPLA